MRSSLLLYALMFGGSARAACPTDFDDFAIRKLVDRANAAIDAEDLGAMAAIEGEFDAGVPCLAQQLPRRSWADYLVAVSLVRFSEGDDAWHQTLALALRLVPNHPDVPDFLLAEHQPPPAHAGASTPVPRDRVVVLDGRIVDGALEPLAGLHIVQTLEEGEWTSQIVRGALPEDFFGETPVTTVPPESVPTETPTHWGTLNLSGGFGAWSQRPSPSDTSGVLDSRSVSGPRVGGSSHGQVPISGPVGVFWTGDVAIQPTETGSIPFGSAFAGASFIDMPITVWLGGGVMFNRFESFEGPGSVVFPHYLVGVAYRAFAPRALDVFAGGGWGPWGSHAQVRVGTTLFDIGDLGLRLGGHGTFADAHLVNRAYDDAPTLGRSGRWEGGLDLGLSWGDRSRQRGL